MSSSIFISTSGKKGVARAFIDTSGQWSVDFLLQGIDMRCISAAPGSPGVVYAGTQGGGVLRSDDNGLTWKPAGLDGLVIKSICASPADPNTVYAGTKPLGLYVSHNRGATWQELETFRQKRAFWWFSPADGKPYTPYVQSIALSPTDPDLILAGVELGAVLRSTDGGKTWEGHRPGALRDCHSLVGHAVNGDWFYEGGGSGNGAAFSKDGGKSWRQPSSGLDRHYGWAVASDPARPEIWYAALSPSAWKAHSEKEAQANIFRSAGGAAWQKLGRGLPQPLNSMPYALLTNPDEPGHLYAGLGDGSVWFSPDHGDGWEPLPFKLPGIQRSLIRLSF